ncbi:ribosomal protein L7/L12 [Streptomyces glaucescens]|uniref:ribosomal protein L7/L12 n=1 Tax=Streptomyces glaucescens TaxID=1907 RepID=UPI00344EBDFE
MGESYLVICDDQPHDAILTDPGPQVIEVVKLLSRRTRLSLWRCKSLVSQLPATVLANVPVEVATSLVDELREAGACAHTEVKSRREQSTANWTVCVRWTGGGPGDQ